MENQNNTQPNKKKSVFKTVATVAGLSAAIAGSVKYTASIDCDAHNRRVAAGRIADAERIIARAENCQECQETENWLNARELREHKHYHAMLKNIAENDKKTSQRILQYLDNKTVIDDVTYTVDDREM